MFTLGHGEFTVLLMDWIWRLCSYENHHSEESHVIFPAARGVAYTMELMYWWICEMCRNTRSFPALYQRTRKLLQTCSYNRRFRTGRLHMVNASHRANRRIANYAVRNFI